MFSTEDFIIAVFCCVDDLWHLVTQGQKIRKGGFTPSLSHSEVITMEIVGEFLGIETDKGIWGYFLTHWLSLFPGIKSRTTFIRQASNLWCYKQHLQRLLAGKLGGFDDSIHLIDGFPIPWCHYQRAKARLALGEETSPSLLKAVGYLWSQQVLVIVLLKTRSTMVFTDI